MNVKAIRQRKGWNQQELADYLGLDRSSVSRLENGQEPSGPVLKLLASLEPAKPDCASAEAAE